MSTKDNSVASTAQQVDQDSSFVSTKSVQALTTKVIEAVVRQPVTINGYAFSETERRAQAALGLRENEPFIVIARVRLLEESPCAFHVAYLNPARFPADFVKRHDFTSESLVNIYRRHGFTLLTRGTTLSARSASNYERQTLGTPTSPLNAQVVLDVEQRLYASGGALTQPTVLEFLKAAYFDDWKYEIKN